MFLGILPRNSMSSSDFASLADCKAKVLAAIAPELGTYSASSGVPIAAIWIVRNTDEDPPHHVERLGLECLIFPPITEGIPLHNGAVLQSRWRIRLIQHDRTKSTRDGHRALLRAYPQLKKEGWLAQSSELNEQLNLSLYGHEIL